MRMRCRTNTQTSGTLFLNNSSISQSIQQQGIALEEARRMNLSLPGLALAHQFYVALAAQGGGKLGTQALALVLERMNGMGDMDGGKTGGSST